MAHLRPSRPDSGLGFQAKAVSKLQAVPSLLEAGLRGAVAVVFDAERKERHAPRGRLRERRNLVF
jgi:hypothetical protein